MTFTRRSAEWPAWALSALLPDLRRGFFSRLAETPPTFSADATPRLWLHAATRKQARLARLLADELKAQAPELQLLFTSLTIDAQQAFADCEYAQCRLLPFNNSQCLRRLWDAIQPKGLVLVENELWPALLELANERAVPVFVANARFCSEGLRALAQNAFRQKPLFTSPVYLARHDTDLKALREAGVPLEKLFVCGEMKVDLALSEVRKHTLCEVPCFIGVGTHFDDEKLLLAAYRELLNDYPELRLVLAPHSPKRAKALRAWVAAQDFSVELDDDGAVAKTLSRKNAEVIIVPGFENLAGWYAVAQAAYVGGGLGEGQGTHNLTEPVLHGVPVLCGPNVGDWRPFSQQLDEAGALSFVQSAEDVARLVAICVSQADELAPAIKLGRTRLLQHKGAAKRQADLILQGLAYPCEGSKEATKP